MGSLVQGSMMKTIIVVFSALALVKALCDRDCECKDAFHSECAEPSPSQAVHTTTLELCIAHCEIFPDYCNFVIFKGNSSQTNCLMIASETLETFLGSCAIDGGPLRTTEGGCFQDSEGECQSSSCGGDCVSCSGDRCFGVTEHMCSMAGHHIDTSQASRATCQEHCTEASWGGGNFTYFTFTSYSDTCSCYASGGRVCGAQVVKAGISAETAESCLEPTTPDPPVTTTTTPETTTVTHVTTTTTPDTTTAPESTTRAPEPTTIATEPTTTNPEQTTTPEPTPTTSQPSPGCPDVEEDGFCYWLLQTYETRDECKEVCRMEGGDLVSIHGIEEERLVKDLINKYGSNTGVWLGAMSWGLGWSWDDLSPWDFQNWQWDQPSNESLPACLYTYDDGLWLDSVCWPTTDNRDWDCVCKRST